MNSLVFFIQALINRKFYITQLMYFQHLNQNPKGFCLDQKIYQLYTYSNKDKQKKAHQNDKPYEF